MSILMRMGRVRTELDVGLEARVQVVAMDVV